MRLFRKKIYDYYQEYGRDLIWRRQPTPYGVVISELMLQQTQVARVGDYFPVWMERFPSFEVLAAASVREVMQMWQGLGYNRRALWLKAIAEQVSTHYQGELPRNPSDLVKLPGIGVNTAGSIAAFAYNEPVVFIETNIRRVFLNEFFAGQEGVPDRELLAVIREALDRDNPRRWYYALMDYGAGLSKLVTNPNRRSAHYVRQSQFEGSTRQLRGTILAQLIAGPKSVAELNISDSRLGDVISALLKEGFIHEVGGRFEL